MVSADRRILMLLGVLLILLICGCHFKPEENVTEIKEEKNPDDSKEVKSSVLLEDNFNEPS
jgi:hypothetical protein